jgi:hypothetical protein
MQTTPTNIHPVWPSRIQFSQLFKQLEPLSCTITGSEGSEARTIRRLDKRRLISAEMHFMRKMTGYGLLSGKRNEKEITEFQTSHYQNLYS